MSVTDVRFGGNISRVLNDVTLDQLCVFIASAQSRSFSDAARKCGKTQSAVSKSITNLELDLGVELFERSIHGISLTMIGRELLPISVDVVNRVRGLCGRAATLREGRDQATLFVDALFPFEQLNILLTAFARRHPNYDVVVKLESPIDVLRRWQSEPHSIIITSRNLEMHSNETLSTQAICHTTFVPVVSRDHEIAKANAVDEDSLRRHRQIKFLMGRQSQQRYNDSSNIFVDSLFSQMNLIKQGLGWGYLPEYLVDDLIRQGRLKKMVFNGHSTPKRLDFRLGWRLAEGEGGANQALIELCAALYGGPEPFSYDKIPA